MLVTCHSLSLSFSLSLSSPLPTSTSHSPSASPPPLSFSFRALAGDATLSEHYAFCGMHHIFDKHTDASESLHYIIMT